MFFALTIHVYLNFLLIANGDLFLEFLIFGLELTITQRFPKKVLRHVMLEPEFHFIFIDKNGHVPPAR